MHLLNKISLASFIVGLAIHVSAFAVVTSNPLPTKGSAPQVCFIKFTGGNNQVDSSNPMQAQAGCTGTLIRTNRLLTAAHCLDNIVNLGESVEVICNNGKQDYEVIGYEADPAYARTPDSSGHTTSDVHDVALFDLKPPKKNAIAPITLVSDYNDLNTLLASPQNCSLYGYGRPDDGDGNNWGNLVIGAMDYLNPQTIDAMTGWTVDPLEDIYIGPSVHAAPGDSGGPILCKRADGSLVQIATTMEESTIPNPSNPSQLIHLSRHEATPFNFDWIDPAANAPTLQHKL